MMITMTLATGGCASERVLANISFCILKALAYIHAVGPPLIHLIPILFNILNRNIKFIGTLNPAIC